MFVAGEYHGSNADEDFFRSVYSFISDHLTEFHVSRMRQMRKQKFRSVLNKSGNLAEARDTTNKWFLDLCKSILQINGIEIAFKNETQLRVEAHSYVLKYKRFDCRYLNGFKVDENRPSPKDITPFFEIDSVKSIIPFYEIKADSNESRLLRAQDFRFWIRQLRVLSAQAAEMVAFHLQLLNKSMPYCSIYNQTRRKYQKQRNDNFLASSFISNGKQTIALSEASKAPKQRAAELYAASKGVESIAKQKGFTWLFVTYTCPPHMHPCPIEGKNTWSGVSPKEAAAYQQESWAKVRAMLAKSNTDIFGMWCREPHKSGAPHQHFLIYCSEFDIDRVVQCMAYHCNHSAKDPYSLSEEETEQGVIFGTPALQIKKALSKEDGGASAASYIQKYIQKSLNADQSEDTLAVEAAAANFRYRRYGFFGIKAGLTLYRLFRKADIKDVPEFSKGACECAQEGDFAGFLNNLYPEVKVLRENYLNSYKEQASRIIGIIDTETHERIIFESEWIEAEMPLDLNKHKGLQINTVVQGGEGFTSRIGENSIV